MAISTSSPKKRADHAGLRLEGHRRGCAAGHAPGEPREAPRAVAAHLGLATVGIVVAHAEVGSVPGGLDSKQAVGADAAVAVAKAGDLVARDVEGAVAVIDHHEVVAGSVHLGEGKCHGTRKRIAAPRLRASLERLFASACMRRLNVS
jgi:hypothetical protein